MMPAKRIDAEPNWQILETKCRLRSGRDDAVDVVAAAAAAVAAVAAAGGVEGACAMVRV